MNNKNRYNIKFIDDIRYIFLILILLLFFVIIIGILNPSSCGSGNCLESLGFSVIFSICIGLIVGLSILSVFGDFLEEKN